jgi:hypothetical protein
MFLYTPKDAVKELAAIAFVAVVSWLLKHRGAPARLLH